MATLRTLILIDIFHVLEKGIAKIGPRIDFGRKLGKMAVNILNNPGLSHRSARKKNGITPRHLKDLLGTLSIENITIANDRYIFCRLFAFTDVFPIGRPL